MPQHLTCVSLPKLGCKASSESPAKKELGKARLFMVITISDSTDEGVIQAVARCALIFAFFQATNGW